MAEESREFISSTDTVSGASTYEEILRKGQPLVYTNVGKSMMPLLRQRRDILIIDPKPAGRLKKYDVPLYKRGKKYILHRIVEVTDTGYVIIGDNNTFFEYDVTDDMILGVLTGFVRNDPAGIEKLMFWKRDRRMEGKRWSTEDKAYQVYVHLWCDHLPVRIGILKFRNGCRRILSRIYHFIKGDGRIGTGTDPSGAFSKACTASRFSREACNFVCLLVFYNCCTIESGTVY